MRQERKGDARVAEFRVLGPVEIVVGGRPVALDGRRSREVLAYLLLHANRPVPSAELVERLWGDDAPLTAEAGVRVAVSKLRRALDPVGLRGLLATDRGGYVLVVEPDRIDAERFVALAAEGRAALADERPAEAAAALEAALALWRGEPYAELGGALGAGSEAARRLVGARLAAQEDLFDAGLALGLHAGLAPELEQFVRQHPTRERLTAQLMLALYRSGRQADALAAYRRTRDLLDRELGLEPGPALRSLEQRILRHDESLAVSPVGSRSRREGARAPMRRGRLLGWVAAGALAAGVAAVLVVATSGEALRGLEPDEVGALEDGRLVKALPVGSRPVGLAVDAGRLWVVGAGDGTLTLIDLAAREARDTIRVGGQPTAVAAADGSVWVIEPARGELIRVNAGTAEVVQRTRVGVRPAALAVAAGTVWVANAGDWTVTRVDAAGGKVVSTTPLSAEPAAVAVGEGAVWVAHDAVGVVTRIDPATGRPSSSISVGAGAGGIAAGAGAVWVANGLDGTISRIDPRREAVTATLDVGGEPAGIAATAAGVWVADAGGRVVEIDPGALRVRQRIEVGQRPSALAAADGAVWVAALPGTAARGGTLRVEAFGVPGLDPADAPPLGDGDVLRLVYDGLLAYRAAEGTAGNSVVPNLARALPLVGEDGRTYTFKLREGIVFSDGSRLRASDVKRSVERAQALEWGEMMLGGIASVEADDASGTVVLRLREPDPDLVYKLALPVASVLPLAARSAPLERPVPGTGPYRIASYRPGEQLVLVRNARFASWSQSARPGGSPDRIEVRFVQEPAARRDDVLAGGADLAAIGLAADPGELATRYADRVHRWALARTHFLFLNTTEPPFDDHRVRRAVALAVDRRRVVGIFGGPSVSTPTCQHIPPVISGYRPHCAFAARGSGGVAPAPRLAEARRLVAESGAAGTRIRVWAPADPPERAELGRYAVELLRKLGLPARLELRPDLGSYYSAALDPANHVQMGVYSWGNDFPTAGNSFFPMYGCERGRPHEFNPSRFCDARLSRRLEQALTGTALAPTATIAWAELDRAFLEVAAVIPLVNTSEAVVVSPRLENLVLHPQYGPLLELARIR